MKKNKEISNLEEAKRVLLEIKKLNAQIQKIEDSYAPAIEAIEGELQVLKDAVFEAEQAPKAKRDALGQKLESYIRGNWKRDFEGKKTIQLAEGKMYVRKCIQLEAADWQEVVGKLERAGRMDALKKEVNKAVLKSWGRDCLRQYGVTKEEKDKPGWKV
jgi:Mg2+ and Co2+ transporter CorA